MVTTHRMEIFDQYVNYTWLITYTIYPSLYSPIHIIFRCTFKQFTDMSALPYVSKFDSKLPKNFRNTPIIIIKFMLLILIASCHCICHVE